MGTCFVMQPFDNGQYDKRYEDVFAPAIEAAGLTPYRVDQDPAASIPIAQIEDSIKASDICFAEITTDNPNVWFELGYAIASQKQVVLVCSSDRTSRFPFDVQHRTIIKYSIESSRDFEKLKIDITKRLKALLKKEEELGRIVSPSALADIEGLTQIEMATLVSIGENIEYSGAVITIYTIRNDMERTGFTKIATTLGLECLARKGLIASGEVYDEDANKYTGWALTSDGMDWLIKNQDKLKLHSVPPTPRVGPPDDDIPF